MILDFYDKNYFILFILFYLYIIYLFTFLLLLYNLTTMGGLLPRKLDHQEEIGREKTYKICEAGIR